MIRVVIFTAAGLAFGACLGCLAALCLCYLLLEVWDLPMPMDRITPIAAAGAAGGALILGLVELLREWRRGRALRSSESSRENSSAGTR